MADTTSSKYDEAKAYFEETERTYTGDLPHCTIWSYSYLDATRNKEILDTGFYAACYQGGGDASISIGSQTFNQYLLDNPNVPLIIRAPRCWTALTNFTSSLPAGCHQTDGSHIGEGNDCAGLAALGFPVDMVSNTAYSFYNGSTPRAVAYVSGTSVIVPILPETLDFWGDYENYAWSQTPYVFGQQIYDVLDADIINHNLKGVLVDQEDFDAVYDSATSCTPSDASGNLTLSQLYDADDRFDPVGEKKDPQVLKSEYVAQMLCRRAEKIYNNAQYMENHDESTFYDFSIQQNGWGAVTYNSPFTVTAAGRKKLEIQIYNAYSGILGLMECLSRHGRWISSAARYGVHCFNFWYAANTPGDVDDTAVAKLDDPVGAGWVEPANINETLAMCKCAMATGSLRILFYNEGTSVNHQYYSIIAAYDIMQPYHEIIKYGTNYIPPADIARNYQTFVLGTDPHQHDVVGVDLKTTITPFYSKDYNGSTISAYVYICCRYYNSQMLFFGCTTNGTTTSVSVRAPDNTSVTVSCTPDGAITLV